MGVKVGAVVEVGGGLKLVWRGRFGWIRHL